MGADDDKLKPANPPEEDDIDLPLPTDWHPGTPNGGSSTRRVTGAQGDQRRDAAAPLARNEADPNVTTGAFRVVQDAPASAPTPSSNATAKPSEPAPQVLESAPPDAPRVVLSPRPVNPAASLTITQQSGGRKVCPKCGFVNANFFSCDRCGLVFSRWKPDMERAEYADVPDPILDRAKVLWKDVEIAQNSDARQAAVMAFQDFCEAHNADSFASVRYRIWLGSHPDDAAVRKGQQRILTRAQFILAKSDGQRKNQIGPIGLMVALVITLILTAFLTVFFLNTFGSGQ